MSIFVKLIVDGTSCDNVFPAMLQSYYILTGNVFNVVEETIMLS